MNQKSTGRWLFLPITGLIFASAVGAVNFGLFQPQIEQLVARKLNAKVKLGPVHFRLTWPLTLLVDASRAEFDRGRLEWKTAVLSISRPFPPYAVSLTLTEPRWQEDAGASIVDAHGNSWPAASSPTRPISFHLQIINGEVHGSALSLTALDLDLTQARMNESLAALHFKALLETSVESQPISIRVAGSTEALTLHSERISLNDLKFVLGGLSGRAKGMSSWSEDRHHWRADIDIPELHELPGGLTLPARDWAGSLRASLEVQKDGREKLWQGTGELAAESLRANLQFHRDQVTLRGPVELSLKARLEASNGALVVPFLEVDGEATQARVIYENVLDKTEGVPLHFKFNGRGDAEHVQINFLELKLWDVLLKVHGSISRMAPYVGRLRVDIPKVSLVGSERLFLPFAGQPVRGELELRGDLQGPLSTPWLSHVVIEALKFKDFAAQISYDADGRLKLRGPVTASLDGKVDVEKERLRRVQMVGRLDLTHAALAMGPLRKEAAQELKLNFQARNQGAALGIDQLDMRSFFGQVRLSGSLGKGGVLKIALAPLDLGELRVALPELHEQIPKGLLRGELELAGQIFTSPHWFDWPLEVGGHLALNLPEFKVEPTPALVKDDAKLQRATPPTTTFSHAFLPKGYLTSHLKTAVRADIGRLVTNEITLQGLHAEGIVAGGKYHGSLLLAQVFAGRLAFHDLEVELLEPRPVLAGGIEGRGLRIQEAMAYADPRYADFASGKATGRAEFQTYLPSDPEFLSFLKVKGDVRLDPVQLNSLRVGQMINDGLAKAPMIKMKPVKVGPLKGWVQTQFDLHSQAVGVESFSAHDADDSELRLKGKVALPSFQGDLVGDFLWSKPQVQGCLLEANSDAQGRMVIPVAIKGDLMQPEFSTLSDLIARLGGRTIECERKKFVERLKAGDGKRLEEEIGKQLKGLFGK